MSSVDPSIFTCGLEERSYERIAYVFQGGGALGSFQVGVMQALHESNYCPDIVSGISIGAINAAILAGNPHEKRIEKLIEFWDRIATTTPFDQLKYPEWVENIYSYLGSYSAVLFGQPGFFSPRMLNPWLLTNAPLNELSFYDNHALRNTLLEFVDFDLINEKKVRLYLGTVCVETGTLTFFSNDTDIITPDHVLASAALPPGFPAVQIGSHYYWDGAVYSNTPLTAVLDAQPEKNTLCFAVNCFTASGAVPNSMDGIDQRVKDIRYSSHLKEYLDLYTERQNFRCAISHLSEQIPDEHKTKEVEALLSLGSPKLVQIVQLDYKTTKFDHASKDFNFTKRALEDHRINGYKTARKALENKLWMKPIPSYIGAILYEESNNGLTQETDYETDK